MGSPVKRLKPENPGSSNGCVSPKMPEWIRLNVGGTVFMTTRSTLTSRDNSFFARLVSEDGCFSSTKDESGAYLIDRDPDYFPPVLNYLRHGKLILNDGVSPEGIVEEAQFYNLPDLVTLAEERIREQEDRLKKPEPAPVKEKERLRSVYRVMGCDGHDELTATVSQLTDGWKLVQVMVNANFSVDQTHEFLVIVTRECPDTDQPLDMQDRAGHIQQRARSAYNNNGFRSFLERIASMVASFISFGFY